MEKNKTEKKNSNPIDDTATIFYLKINQLNNTKLNITQLNIAQLNISYLKITQLNITSLDDPQLYITHHF